MLKLSCPHVHDKAPCPLFCHSAVNAGTDGKRRHFVFVSGDSPFRNTEQSQGQSTRVNRLKICVYVCVRAWISDDGSAVCHHKPITGALTAVGLGSR